MALKQTVLSFKIGEKRRAFEALKEKEKDLNARKADLDKREAELEAAVNEMTPDTDPDDKAAVEKAVEEFTKEAEKLEAEVEENAKEIEAIKAEMDEMQKELDALSDPEPQPEPQPEPDKGDESRKNKKTGNERSMTHMKTRSLAKMTAHERAAFMERAAVKDFVKRAGAAVLGKIANAEITVPTELRPLIREEVERESKLLKYVNHIYVPGETRVPIMGETPVAQWTEQCEPLNPMDLQLYLVELEAFKVGGYMAVCKYLAEDSAENILDTMIFAIARGIAKAVDIAILKGTGVKQPLGIATRIKQQTAPEGAGKYERPWVNLSETNVHIIPADVQGEALMKGIVESFTAVDGIYGKEKKFFAMSEATRMSLMGELISFAASGALVSAVGDTMPVLGGDIVVVEGLEDGVIVGGYGENYVMAERGRMSFDTNDRLRWIEEQVLVKGTARYDGKPTNPKAFVVIEWAKSNAVVA